MSSTSEPEDKVLFVTRLKSLVLHLWSGSMAPSIGRLSRVHLYDEHRDRLLELPVDVISVFQGNYELVLWRRAAKAAAEQAGLRQIRGVADLYDLVNDGMPAFVEVLKEG